VCSLLFIKYVFFSYYIACTVNEIILTRPFNQHFLRQLDTLKVRFTEQTFLGIFRFLPKLNNFAPIFGKNYVFLNQKVVPLKRKVAPSL